ncbi:MAG: DNA primase, partial [Rubrivivax sp.]
MIPPGFIHDLLARVDIVDVVGRHVELKKAGINHKGLCPFHGEKSPSFIVSPSRQTYHCFGCGVHGNAIGFLIEHTGAGFVEAVEDLAQQVGMQVPQDERSPEQREKAKAEKARQESLTDVLARAADFYKAQLRKSPRAVEYLKGRGLTGQIAARFGLGYAPEGWRSLASGFPAYDDPQLVESGLVISPDVEPGEDAKRYDRFRDRVMFPIRNVTGEVIGFGGRVLDKGEPKYLNSPETPVFSKGRELYGLFEGRQAMRQRGYALVVEGYMDVVALAQHGFGNAVATLGTACTAEHVHKLFRFTESVVFSFDGDAAGRRAASPSKLKTTDSVKRNSLW